MDQRLRKYASVLVDYSVAVSPGDRVAIESGVAGLPLARAVYGEALRAGGHPVLYLSDDECHDMLMSSGDDAQLRWRDPLAMREIEAADKWISVWASVNSRSLTRVDPARLAASREAGRPLMELWTRRTCAPEGDPDFLPAVGTACPCQSAAQDAEMSLAEYEDFVFGAALVHLDDPAAGWRRMLAFQEALIDRLNGVRDFRFVTDLGTDVTFHVPPERPWWPCAGKQNFPDGEVYNTPLEDSAEGVIRFGFPTIYDGAEVGGVRLEFRGGRVVDASAEKNEAYLLSMLDLDGARTPGELAFGVNPLITELTRDILFDEKIGGTFHVALGDSYPNTGGTNRSTLHWDMICDLRNPGCRVTGDGRVIQEAGEWAFPLPPLGI